MSAPAVAAQPPTRPGGAPTLARRTRRLLRGMTLRRKLVLSIVALFVLITLTSGLVSVLVTRQSLNDQLDERVRLSVDRAFDAGRGDRRGSPPDTLGPGRGIGGDFLLLEMREGVVRQFTAFTGEGARVESATPETIEALLTAPTGSEPATVGLVGDLGSYRVLRRDTPVGVTVTGLPLRATEEAVRSVVLTTVGVGLLGLLLLAACTAWLIRLSLRPLERVAAVAGRVSQTPLSRGEVELLERVDPADTDPRTEVGQVGVALNELLDHVDAALSARHESETQLRRFVADASHELRTPLASIRGYTELSRREPDPIPDGVEHALTRIDAESSRMASLVEDLLLLARLDSGRQLSREPVDLTMLLIDSVSDARAAGPDHTWRLDLPQEPVETVGDPARLTQVVVNLLANARVHTPPGTTVTAGVRAAGPTAVLTVTDDGPGIKPELLPRVFSRFTRGDQARTRPADVNGRTVGASTGLGLSIVAAVVAAHRGTVDVRSAAGRTTFTVRLPRASA